MVKQIKITIQADEGFVADSLREVANLIENEIVDDGTEMCDYDFETETYHYTAKIEEV